MKKILFLAVSFALSNSLMANTFMAPVSTNPLSYCEYNKTSCASSNHHTGIDYSRHGDHQVVAANSGTIAKIEQLNSRDHGMGNNVIIKHQLKDGRTVYSSYSHLASINHTLAEGDTIYQGETIGEMGGSGYGRQNYWQVHLHFEIKSRATSAAPTNSIYWGYTPQNPDNYGYYNPNDFIDNVDVIEPNQSSITQTEINKLFDYLEDHYPDILSQETTQYGEGYSYRAYSNQRYLVAYQGDLYYYDNEFYNLGSIKDFLNQFNL